MYTLCVWLSYAASTWLLHSKIWYWLWLRPTVQFQLIVICYLSCVASLSVAWFDCGVCETVLQLIRQYEQSPVSYDADALEFQHARDLKQRQKVKRKSSLKTYKASRSFVCVSELLSFLDVKSALYNTLRGLQHSFSCWWPWFCWLRVYDSTSRMLTAGSLLAVKREEGSWPTSEPWWVALNI